MLIGAIAWRSPAEIQRLTQDAKNPWVRPIFNTPHAIARSRDFVVTVTPVAMAAVLLCLTAALALLVVMRASRFGRAWRACADDPIAAALFGVDRRAVLLETFALASLLAGLAGYVVTVYYGTFGYAGGIVLGLKSLLAAVAGGIGSVPGALLGGILWGRRVPVVRTVSHRVPRPSRPLAAGGAAGPAPERHLRPERAAAAEGVTVGSAHLSRQALASRGSFFSTMRA